AEEREVPYFAVSAATGENVDSLILRVGDMVHEERQAAAVLASTQVEARYVHHRTDERTFSVVREGEGWRVIGKGIERMVIMTEMGNDEALAFLQKRLMKAGVEKALEAAGAVDGDDIHIAGVTFEFEGIMGVDEEVEHIEDELE
ncbi:MAG: Obg family GTPase CgtA, partial [Actinomycetota bacterium]|nr:Obg family GTPase CgtA [Actinomycetota bacterium]